MYKLSICMMVKNEELNIERCLNSLEKLRSKINSELIIVDTGSNDDTVKICKKFTDKVYFHQWNDNFSEMRNITISYASGDWLMIIDADEELIDVDNLVLFLLNKQDDLVAGAALYLRNVVNIETMKYSAELVTPRVFRTGRGFRYEGSVHNMPVVNGEIIFVDSLMNHYGYLVDDKELMEKKFLRTRALLLEELANDPGNLYFMYQLASTYGMHQDFAEAYAESQRAYLIASKSEEILKDHLYILGLYAKDCLSINKLEEAVEACLRGIEIEPEYLDLYFYIATAYCRLSNYDKAIEYYLLYLYRRDLFSSSNFRLNVAMQHYSLYKTDEVFSNLGISYFFVSNFTDSYNYLTKALNYIDETSIYFLSVYKAYSLVLIKLRKFSELSASFNKSSSRDRILIESIEESYGSLTSNEKIEISKELAKTGQFYGKIMHLRVNNNSNISSYLDENLTEFANLDFNRTDDYENEVIYFMLKAGADVGSILAKIHEDRLIELLNSLDNKFSDLVSVISGYEFSKYNLNISSVRVLKKYLMYKSLCTSSEIEGIEGYLGAAFDYIKYKYTPEYIGNSNDISGSTVEESFLLQLISLVDLDMSHDVLSKLRRLSVEYPEMACVISYILKTGNFLDEPSSEEDSLVKEFIKQITLLKELGHYKDAIMLIQECREIMSDNKELLLLESEIFLLMIDTKNYN